MVATACQSDLHQFALDVGSRGTFDRSAQTGNDKGSTQECHGCNQSLTIM